MQAQTGDFDNAKRVAAMLNENSPDATCMSITYAPRITLAIYMSVSNPKQQTTALPLFL